jgi:tRNA dimethylallyltransferase
LLYERVNLRVEMMIQDGLVAETARLAEEGLSEAIRRSNVIGYNEILDHLEGRWSLGEAAAAIKQNTRRFAKRQMTWFRGRSDCRFFADTEALMDDIRPLLVSQASPGDKP